MNALTRGLRRAEEYLDGWGRRGWIVAFVLGFILFWPLGLAILLYTIWSGRMGCTAKTRRRSLRRSSGNVAFDDYRDRTLARLEEEQTAFEGFLDRLRRAKDQAQFDEFMAERRERPSGDEPQTA